ncbi:MAG: hypothetical protein HKP50_16960 [Myxococcales bacterium]|nr:hypothetical protein [Myxococcales bacterium]
MSRWGRVGRLLGSPSTDGLANTAVNEHGSSQSHQELVDRFPNSVLQSGLWMVGTWAKTIGHPIYLQIGYEFDGPHNELETSEYVTAYRRFVDITPEEGVNNAVFDFARTHGKPVMVAESSPVHGIRMRGYRTTRRWPKRGSWKPPRTAI